MFLVPHTMICVSAILGPAPQQAFNSCGFQEFTVLF
jgi:hypothetical protein